MVITPTQERPDPDHGGIAAWRQELTAKRNQADPNPPIRTVPLADGRTLLDLGWRLEVRSHLGALVACAYDRGTGDGWRAVHRDGRARFTSKEQAEQTLYGWCGAPVEPADDPNTSCAGNAHGAVCTNPNCVCQCHAAFEARLRAEWDSLAERLRGAIHTMATRIADARALMATTAFFPSTYAAARRAMLRRTKALERLTAALAQAAGNAQGLPSDEQLPGGQVGRFTRTGQVWEQILPTAELARTRGEQVTR